MLKKLSMLALAITLPVILAVMTAGAARAANTHKQCEHLGYCSPGTCAVDGSNRACNIKNCKKSNCRG